MDIYNFMQQKQKAALEGEDTGIDFPFLKRVRIETEAQKIVRKISGN